MILNLRGYQRLKNSFCYMSIELVDFKHLFSYTLCRIYFFFAHVPCVLKN